MVITFFGHSDFFETKEHAKILISKLKSLILDKNKKIDFLLGGKGKFDYFAKRFCRMFQKEYKNAKLIYVSPYLGEFWEKTVPRFLLITMKPCILRREKLSPNLLI